jgi:hypothetical protein
MFKIIRNLIDSLSILLVVLINSYPVVASVFNPVPILEDNLFLIFFVLSLIVVYLIFVASVKSNEIKIPYRFRKHTHDLDIKIDNLRNEPYYMDLTFYKYENDCHIFKLLKWLRFNVFMEVISPEGIGINLEKLCPDFNIIEENMCNILSTFYIKDKGIRSIRLDVDCQNRTSFGGDEPLIIKTYIGCQRILPKILHIELGSEQIKIVTIQPSSRF